MLNISVSVLWRLRRRKNVIPNNKDGRRSDQCEDKSLLLFHSLKSVRTASGSERIIHELRHDPVATAPGTDTKRRQAGALQITSLDHIHPRKTADTAVNAKWPCESRAGRRVFRSLHTHIRNKSERNGKQAVTTARLLLYKTSKPKLKPNASFCR